MTSKNYEAFKNRQEYLIDRINDIHKTMGSVENTLAELDAEASISINELTELEANYYGDSHE